MALSATVKARVREKRIGSATNISIGALTIAGNAQNTTQTVNIPGIGVNDVAVISVQTPTAGVIWTAYVSSSSVVTIVATNIVPATVTSSVTTTATKAQIQTFKL